MKLMRVFRLYQNENCKAERMMTVTQKVYLRYSIDQLCHFKVGWVDFDSPFILFGIYGPGNVSLTFSPIPLPSLYGVRYYFEVYRVFFCSYSLDWCKTILSKEYATNWEFWTSFWILYLLARDIGGGGGGGFPLLAHVFFNVWNMDHRMEWRL